LHKAPEQTEPQIKDQALIGRLADVELTVEAETMDTQVDALFARAFGPGRFAKTAARLRENNLPLRALGRIAWRDGRLAGAAKVWPIQAGPRNAVFFGPFAVEDSLRGQGLGHALAHACCEAAIRDGQSIMVLIGAAAFFAPLGFTPAPHGRLLLPGPVDPERLLWRALDGRDLGDVAGPVTSGWSTA
jgi:predicted N-acetyltransferase YhbS